MPFHHHSRTSPPLVVIVAICLTAFTAHAQQPNIIFILADDLGYGDLSCYGQDIIQTPRLDQMASEGIRFTQAYAGSTVCAPSRSALMTGLHTGHCTVRGNKRVPIPPEDLTVAEVLKSAGYTTGLVGKWGLGNEGTTGVPTRQGFDEFFGFLDQRHAHTYYPEYLWRGETRVPLEGNREERENVAIMRTQYSHDLFTANAIDFIRRHAGDAEPFFLYLAYTIPHANNERGGALGDGMEVPDYGQYVDKDWPDPQKGHAAMISRLDRDVGILLDTLRHRAIAENTLVIFTSDNGPHREGGADPDFFDSNGPLRGIKRNLTEGGIRVPAIAWWPGAVPAGETSDHVWAFWDFLPTAAELAGAEIPANLDGISFAPTLRGNVSAQKTHDHLYWEFHERDFLRAVRKGDWKLIKSKRRDTTELYDLSQDLAEERNLADDRPEIVAQLETVMKNARTPSEHWPVN